jgi:hypothetical protein
MELTYTPQDLQHTIFQLSLDDKLHLAPIPQHVQCVLDVGTGTGLWASDFGIPSSDLLMLVLTTCQAHQHPSAHVIGVDLSPTQDP